MKLSTRGRYGIKAMVDLAMAYGSGQVSANALAKAQGVSEPYLEQLISLLKKADLVQSVRGAQGGYSLKRPPEEITVGEVLYALEGTTDLLDCVGVKNLSCKNVCQCSARPLWLKLQTRINEVLYSTTIKDMADDYKIQMRRVNQNESLS